MDNQLAVYAQDSTTLALWHTALDLDTSTVLSETTNTTYKRGMERFTRWCRDNQVEVVTPDVVRKWIRELRDSGAKPAAINTWLAGVRHFYKYAFERGLCKINPTANIKGIKRTGANKRHSRTGLTNTEMLRVLSQTDRKTLAGTRDYAMLMLKAYTIIRDVELHRADLNSLATENGKLVLRVQIKGDTEANVPKIIVNPDAQNALLEWLSVRGKKDGALFISLSDRSYNERLSLAAIRRIVKGYMIKAGVVDRNKTSHSFRHKATTNAILNGASMPTVKGMGGWRSDDTVDIYYHNMNRMTDPGEKYIDYTRDNGS